MGIFIGLLEYITVIYLFILWQFGNLVPIWYTYFLRFGILNKEKSGKPEFFPCTICWEELFSLPRGQKAGGSATV
jgi:hypothetical protein